MTREGISENKVECAWKHHSGGFVSLVGLVYLVEFICVECTWEHKSEGAGTRDARVRV